MLNESAEQCSRPVAPCSRPESRLNPALPTSVALQRPKAIFARCNPAFPFEANFIDQEFTRKFDRVRTIGRMADVFAVLTVVIACPGLFGLATFMLSAASEKSACGKQWGLSAQLGQPAQPRFSEVSRRVDPDRHTLSPVADEPLVAGLGLPLPHDPRLAVLRFSWWLSRANRVHYRFVSKHPRRPHQPRRGAAK